MDERGHQILRMKELYSKALLTVAWLGSDSGGYARMAFKCMTLLKHSRLLAEFIELSRAIEKWFPDLDPIMPELVAFQQMLKLVYW